jgi:tetratricopeptide (TPR) repeat protein
MGVMGCSRSAEPKEPENPGPPPPRTVEESIEAAERLFSTDRLADAESIAKALTQRAPDAWQGHELLGRIRSALALGLAESGDEAGAALRREEAVRSYRRALELHPAAPELHHAAGLALLAADRPEEALMAFGEAGRRDPLAAQYPLFEAQVHLAAGRTAEARAALARVLALRPEEAFAWASLAECHRQEGNLEAALREIRAARRLDRAAAAFRVAEARLLRLSGRPRDAIELLLAAGEPAWSEPSAVEEVALGWKALGEPGRAALAWEACQRRHPHHTAALRRAAQAWREAGDPVRAQLLEREAAVAGAVDQ